VAVVSNALAKSNNVENLAVSFTSFYNADIVAVKTDTLSFW